MSTKRIVLLILDGCGIGVQDDSQIFHSVSANTLGHVYARTPGLSLPFLESMGLGALLGLSQNRGRGSFCSLREQTSGNDTFAGVWEMFGTVFTDRFLSLSKIPGDLLEILKKQHGLVTICNEYISGYIALDKFFSQHKESGLPILYLSDDGVILLAAHDEVIEPDVLNIMAESIAACWFGRGFTRIITRPFSGARSQFFRIEEKRKDFLLLDVPDKDPFGCFFEAGIKVRITEHLDRIFGSPSGVDVLREKYRNNADLFSLIEKDFLSRSFNLMLYVLPDTDNMGHKKDINGFAKSLKKVDEFLLSFTEHFFEDDLLIVAADHGCDPTTNLRGHTREKIPLLFFSSVFAGLHALDPGDTFADIGNTIRGIFDLPELSIGRKLRVF